MSEGAAQAKAAADAINDNIDALKDKAGSFHSIVSMKFRKTFLF